MATRTPRHRAWGPLQPHRVGVDTLLTGFPQVRTPATRRVRVTSRGRREQSSQAARAAAWRAQREVAQIASAVAR